MTELGIRATPEDRVVVDGRVVAGRPELVYVVLNKPAGVVTTLHDPQGRPTVRMLLARDLPRVVPVGRLDMQSTGLLLLTNDGGLASRLMHPRHHVARTYRVKVRGKPDARALTRLRRGVRLDDGPAAAAEVVVEKDLPTKTWLRIVVHEGRKHLVRRMCDAIGHAVEKLQRIGLGPLTLGRLELGAARMLTRTEVGALRRAAGCDSRASGADAATSRRRVRAAVPEDRRRPRSAAARRED